MDTKTIPDYDIVIAGGGMVGASLALLLSHQSNRCLKILVVESVAPVPKSTVNPLQFRPSFDARSTAISYGSRLLLEPLGLWPHLSERLADIESIHVCERGRMGSMLMSKQETQWPALGYVVENAWLGQVLFAALAQHSNITIESPASVRAIGMERNGVFVDVMNDQHAIKKLQTTLVVVADGADSALRQQLGIAVKTQKYNQTALIANVSFTKAHNGRAYERFTEQGPMALLPLSDSENMPRSALVWTMPDDEARVLLSCSEQEFLSQLQCRFGNRQGEFIRVGQRASYPLTLVQAVEQVRSNIVIMGNAAHTLHPVAGQGFNLALRDCARLAMITTANFKNNIAIGAMSSLSRYVDQQQFDQEKTIAFSDYLPAIFANRCWGASLFRCLGLAALDVMPAAKKQFIYHAGGLHDDVAFSAVDTPKEVAGQ